MITLPGLNIVEQVIEPIKPMCKSPVSSDIPIKLVPVQLVKIVIPPDIFQQHLPEMFFQLEVGEMGIDEMLARIKIQNLCITGWIVIEEEQLTKINLDFED